MTSLVYMIPLFSHNLSIAKGHRYQLHMIKFSVLKLSVPCLKLCPRVSLIGESKYIAINPSTSAWSAHDSVIEFSSYIGANSPWIMAITRLNLEAK